MQSDKSFFFDKLEKKFVFKISRTFFWIVTAGTVLTIITSLLLLFYSFVPPDKEEVKIQSPPEIPKISYEELINHLQPQLPSEDLIKQKEIKVKPSDITLREIPIEIKKSKLEILLDSLGTYFPSAWEPIYKQYATSMDFSGRVTGYRKEFVSYGIKIKVERFLKIFSNDTIRMQVLTDVLNILPKIDVADRKRAMESYINLWEIKWNKYNNDLEEIRIENDSRISQAEAQYLNDKFEKEKLEDYALKGLAGGIALIAFLGLFLSLLAIERNTRMINELIKKMI